MTLPKVGVLSARIIIYKVMKTRSIIKLLFADCKIVRQRSSVRYQQEEP